MREERDVISLLQDNLASVRKIAGWTVEDFGDKIGVTRQTISNLENQKTLMTRTQYIAICAVLQYEVFSNKNKEVLSDVINILVNNTEDYSKEEKKEIGKNIEILAALASAGGMEKKDLMEFSEKLGIAAIATNITYPEVLIGSGVENMFVGASIGAVAAGTLKKSLIGGSRVTSVMPSNWLGLILGFKKKTKTKKNRRV